MVISSLLMNGDLLGARAAQAQRLGPDERGRVLFLRRRQLVVHAAFSIAALAPAYGQLACMIGCADEHAAALAYQRQAVALGVEHFCADRQRFTKVVAQGQQHGLAGQRGVLEHHHCAEAWRHVL